MTTNTEAEKAAEELYPMMGDRLTTSRQRDTFLAGWQAKEDSTGWIDVKAIVVEVLKRAAENGSYYTMRDTASDVENAILNTKYEDLLP